MADAGFSVSFFGVSDDVSCWRRTRDLSHLCFAQSVVCQLAIFKMLFKTAVAIAIGSGIVVAKGAEQVPLEQVPLVKVDSSLDRNGQSSNHAGKRPNVVMILTDDQDMHMQSLDYMPLLKKHMMDRGTFYKRHFCTTAVCCPARVTLWTGRTAHNTNVTDVNPPHGKYP